MSTQNPITVGVQPLSDTDGGVSARLSYGGESSQNSSSSQSQGKSHKSSFHERPKSADLLTEVIKDDSKPHGLKTLQN